MTDHNGIYFPMDHTPEEWKAKAQDCRRRSAESWERSDTDGFLSQRAADSMARMYDYLAELATDGGRTLFQRISDLDGNILEASQFEGQWGWRWRIENADGTVTWFSESQARKGEARIKAHAKKGYKFVEVEQDAVVTMGKGWGCHPLAKQGTEPTLIRDWPETDY